MENILKSVTWCRRAFIQNWACESYGLCVSLVFKYRWILLYKPDTLGNNSLTIHVFHVLASVLTSACADCVKIMSQCVCYYSGFAWNESDWNESKWRGEKMEWIRMKRIRLKWIRVKWIRLNWFRVKWIKVNWTESV